MDNLKTVNDTRGHDAGDKALQRLADALRNQLRRTDEAYRIGGDEFAIVLPKASRLDAERVMRRLREGLAAPVGGSQTIEASFGIALHEPGDDPEHVVARADGALYKAKRRRAESVA
jgi:diguanylate cyclase (GGDEF)-like protein